MPSILMVCLGNICRSPLAEGILRSKLPSDRFIVDSAGTGNFHLGKKPDPRSIHVARKNGLDISVQRARQFSLSDFDKFDFIYAMDEYNSDQILKLARNKTDREKVGILLNVLYPQQNRSVPDPYYGGLAEFSKAYELIDEACTVIAKNLLAHW